MPATVRPLEGVTASLDGDQPSITVDADLPVPDRAVAWSLAEGSGEPVGRAEEITVRLEMRDWSNELVQTTAEFPEQVATVYCSAANTPPAIEAALRAARVGSSLVVVLRREDFADLAVPTSSPAFANVITIVAAR